MVVLEEGTMLTTGHNQYLQPDYLSPLPTTLDAKKSPLALLAQTCSQIGADSPSKPLISSLEGGKSSKGSSAALNGRSPPAAKLERTRSSPADNVTSSTKSSSNSTSGSNLAFKPYESTVVSTKRSSIDESSSSSSSSRPSSKSSSVHSASGVSGGGASGVGAGAGCDNSAIGGPTSDGKSSRSTPGRKSASPVSQQQRSSPSIVSGVSLSPGSAEVKASSSPKMASGASPVVRSGLEVLSGSRSESSAAAAAAAAASNLYKSAMFNPLCCPPGLVDGSAAGFRSPFGAGATSYAAAAAAAHQHAAATAALLGYPGAPAASPYLSYVRVKTPGGGESVVPVCKDPYCTGCQYSMHNAQMMMAAAAAASSQQHQQQHHQQQPPCPSGCSQCDHQKYGLMALAGLGGPMAPPSGYPGAAGARHHVCNWIAGDSYCGKRFSTSDELLQHLRSHTSLAAAAAAGGGASAAELLQHPLLSPTLHRGAAPGASAAGYPAPPLSPLSARYHPYAKPPQAGVAPPPLPASLAASPYSAFNALGPYYSPYAIYGQRLGAAAVHP